jgi:hypothetical protein
MEKQEKDKAKMIMPGPLPPPGPVPEERTRELGIKLVKAGIELIEAAENTGPWPLYGAKPKEE